MIAVIDNYDSFTWNLVDLLRQVYSDVQVFRNDALAAGQLLALQPRGILFSPGPGRPADSGICPAVLEEAAGKIPLLGICLGHQLIGEHFGMTLGEGKEPVHGKTSLLQHLGKGIFAGLEDPFQAMRYHSLILAADTLPSCLEITAWTDAHEVMGIRHKSLAIEGLQFHPESVLSPTGPRLLQNWVQGLG
jgi:anthranilate synthase component II